MNQVITHPQPEVHIAACGLFCTNCGKFKKGKCKGCQVEPGFSRCSIRHCCIEQGITTCVECDLFKSPADFRDCGKINNLIARVFSLIFGSDRPGSLRMLRDQGLDTYLTSKRETGQM